MSSNNPLLENYDTPFNAVPFDRIKTEHFLPAIETGINMAKNNIAVISPNFLINKFSIFLPKK